MDKKQRTPVAFGVSWEKLRKHLQIKEPEVKEGDFWIVQDPTQILIEISAYSNKNSAKGMWDAVAKRGLAVRIGPSNRWAKWRIYNLPLNTVNLPYNKSESASANDNFPAAEVLERLIDLLEDSNKLRAALGESFGFNTDGVTRATAFILACVEEMENIGKVKKAVEAHLKYAQAFVEI